MSPNASRQSHFRAVQFETQIKAGVTKQSSAKFQDAFDTRVSVVNRKSPSVRRPEGLEMSQPSQEEPKRGAARRLDVPLDRGTAEERSEGVEGNRPCPQSQMRAGFECRNCQSLRSLTINIERVETLQRPCGPVRTTANLKLLANRNNQARPPSSDYLLNEQFPRPRPEIFRNIFFRGRFSVRHPNQFDLLLPLVQVHNNLGDKH